MSQQYVANSTDNGHFSINLVEGFLAKTLNPNAGVQASFFNHRTVLSTKEQTCLCNAPEIHK